MYDDNFFSGKNIIVSKGHLVPPLDAHANDWRPTAVKQSLYLTLKESADRHLAEGGDWKWTVDLISGEEVTVKDAFKLANGCEKKDDSLRVLTLYNCVIYST